MLLPTASNVLNRAFFFSFSFSFSSPPLLLLPCFYYPRRIQTLKSTPPKTLPATTPTPTTTNDDAAAVIMARGGGGGGGGGDRYRDPSANPKVARLRELVSGGDATTGSSISSLYFFFIFIFIFLCDHLAEYIIFKHRMLSGSLAFWR